MDLDHQEHIPQTKLRSPEIENNHQLIHRSKYLIWSLQFVVSLSVLSLFITYLTGISLYYSYTYYFSTFFLPLVSRTLERKYVFLLCNGIILVFLVGFRGLHEHHHHYHGFDVDITVNYEGFHDYGLDTIKTSLETDVGVLEDQIHDIRETTSLEDEVEEEEGEREEFVGSNFMVEDDDPNKEEEEEDEEGRRDGEDEAGDEKELVRSISSCTDDELNKKFDEFIRKMKEELRLEAKEYQLIPA